MAIIKTECSCGMQHLFDGEALKKMELSEAPEYVECSECPVCSPELFDTPEDHEDEAYKEEADIEKLLNGEKLEDIQDLDAEEDFDEFEENPY